MICDIESKETINPSEILMTDDLTAAPAYRSTMDRLEALKKVTPNGKDYWLAREIGPVLGYPNWREFGHVIERAMAACTATEIDPAKHFVPTHRGSVSIDGSLHGSFACCRRVPKFPYCSISWRYSSHCSTVRPIACMVARFCVMRRSVPQTQQARSGSCRRGWRTNS